MWGAPELGLEGRGLPSDHFRRDISASQKGPFHLPGRRGWWNRSLGLLSHLLSPYPAPLPRGLGGRGLVPPSSLPSLLRNSDFHSNCP